MITLYFIIKMNTDQRRIVKKDKGNGVSGYSAPMKKNTSVVNIVDTSSIDRYFLNFQEQSVILFKDDKIVFNATKSKLFPPIDNNTTLSQLRDYDELQEVNYAYAVEKLTEWNLLAQNKSVDLANCLYNITHK